MNSSVVNFVINRENSAQKFPKVSIIVLNWNGRNDTLECLESVERIEYPNFDVVVVDNGSNDDSVAAIHAKFPEITLLETGKNLGYAGGNNVGIHHALQQNANYILLLNNDTVVDPALVQQFVEAGQLMPEGGAFGAKIYLYSKPDLPACTCRASLQ